MARLDYRSFHPHGRCLSGANVANTRTAPAAVLERVARIEAVCERHGVPLPAAALQFPPGHPLVVSVIPGARSIAELPPVQPRGAVERPQDRGSCRCGCAIAGREGDLNEKGRRKRSGRPSGKFPAAHHNAASIACHIASGMGSFAHSRFCATRSGRLMPSTSALTRGERSGNWMAAA